MNERSRVNNSIYIHEAIRLFTLAGEPIINSYGSIMVQLRNRVKAYYTMQHWHVDMSRANAKNGRKFYEK